MTGKLTVHLRVNDAATGQPTPVRLSVQGPQGEPFAPFGRFPDFATGRGEDVAGPVAVGARRSYPIDGTCEIALPAGVPLTVGISKGPEYRPLSESVTLGPGKMALRFQVERWADWRAQGWYPGDVRAHNLSPHAALLEAAAEDLAVVNLLAVEQDAASQDGKLYRRAPNVEAFSGTAPALARDGTLVAVNTLNTHPALGRLSLLNSHRPVFPLAFGGADATDDWSLCDWCDQCHRKKGLVVWPDPFRPGAGLFGGEALVALLLGKVDALEVDSRERAQPLLPAWYRLLDGGFRVPAVGGSGKDSNRTHLGNTRTYAGVGADRPLDYGAWVEAVRAGRTFVTSGPLLRLTVNGQPPGSVIEAPADASFKVEASAEGFEPWDRLAVVVNGQVAAETPASGSPAGGRLVLQAPLPAGGWIAARCLSAGKASLYPEVKLFAHTSPVYVRVTGAEPAGRAAARARLRAHVEQTREWVVTEGRFASDRNRERLLRRIDEAFAILDGRDPPAPDRPPPH